MYLWWCVILIVAYLVVTTSAVGCEIQWYIQDSNMHRGHLGNSPKLVSCPRSASTFLKPGWSSLLPPRPHLRYCWLVGWLCAWTSVGIDRLIQNDFLWHALLNAWSSVFIVWCFVINVCVVVQMLSILSYVWSIKNCFCSLCKLLFFSVKLFCYSTKLYVCVVLM